MSDDRRELGSGIVLSLVVLAIVVFGCWLAGVLARQSEFAPTQVLPAPGEHSVVVEREP